MRVVLVSLVAALLGACDFARGTLAGDALGDPSIRDAAPSHDGATGGADAAAADAAATDAATDAAIGGGTIVFLGYASAATSGGTTIAVPATVLPGGTHVLGVSTKPYTATVSVTGLGATWTAIADQCGARSQTGVAMYVGRGATASGSITVTINSGATNAIAIAGHYGGSTSNGASARYNALDASTCNSNDSGVDVSSYSFGIASQPLGHVVAMVATRQRTHTPGAGLVQRVQQMSGSSGDTAGLALTDGAVTSVSGTFSSEIDVAVVAIELR